jgi:hypothetical protein
MQGGDLKYAIKYIEDYNLTYDERQYSRELNVFTGFAAIHYAIMNNHFNLLNFLLPFELLAQTQHENSILTNGQNVQLESGLTIV